MPFKMSKDQKPIGSRGLTNCLLERRRLVMKLSVRRVTTFESAIFDLSSSLFSSRSSEIQGSATFGITFRNANTGLAIIFGVIHKLLF
jgi:hypothetical protein